MEMEVAETSQLPRRYNEAWQESDITFHVENDTFHCHYTILKLHSPVFTNMFKEGSEKVVQLLGKDKEAFNTFLDLMYPYPPEPGNKTPQEREILRTVFDYCTEYEMDDVKRYVEILLQKVYPLPQETPSLILAMDDVWSSQLRDGLEKNKDLAMEFVLCSASSSAVYARGMDGTKFDQLTGENKFEILKGIIKRHDLNSFSIQQVIKNISR